MATRRDQILTEFCARHALGSSFRHSAERFFLPLIESLPAQRDNRPLLLGISGAQGTGKSTLAAFIHAVTTAAYGWRCAVLSLDDFYLTHEQRRELAERVHPLLQTRGVPGTHDISMLLGCLEELRRAQAPERVALPRFDKATDDRIETKAWPSVAAPLDLIILEGWCLGATAQPETDLKTPINELERNEDADGRWRQYVNRQLAEEYPPITAEIDRMIALQSPDYAAARSWREQQEHALAERVGNSAGVMNSQRLDRFLQHFERVTRANFETIAAAADTLFLLNDTHAVVDCI